MAGFRVTPSSDLRPRGQALIQCPSPMGNNDALLHTFAQPVSIPDITLHAPAHLYPQMMHSHMGHVGDLGLYPKQWESTEWEPGSSLVRLVFLKDPAGH